MDIVADPKIFQHTRTRLRSYRLKGSVAVSQRRPDQLRAEGILLHNDRRAKRKISVARQYAHAVRHGRDNVDFSVASEIRQSQSVRQSAGKNNISHANEVLVSIIAENKDASILSRTRFFFGKHNVEVAVAIEIGSVNGALTAGEDIRYNRGSERSVAVVQCRPKMIRRIITVGREDHIDEAVAINVAQFHLGEISRGRVIDGRSERPVTVILENF